MPTSAHGPWNVRWTEYFSPATVRHRAVRTSRRIGGCVHKVIRWAFEAQGCTPRLEHHQHAGPSTPGRYLHPDRRPTRKPRRRAISTMDRAATIRSRLNGIQPDPVRISAQVASRPARSRVGRRNFRERREPWQRASTDVSVSVWWRAWPAGPTAKVEYPTPAVAAVSLDRARHQKQRPGGQFNFSTLRRPPPAGTRYLLLAQATCLDDLANIDADHPRQPSVQPKLTPLIDLVANDNNLGLRVLRR